MYKTKTFHILILFFCYIIDLSGQSAALDTVSYFPLIKGKPIAVVTNTNSLVDGQQHLVDYLLDRQVVISVIFTPEHGFGSTADAGKHVPNSTYKGIPVVSLYGKNKKPKPKDLDFARLIVFDLQDVGARFYTYLSTLHYVMEAAAENHIPMIVLDRPNPNIHYVDGPVLDTAFSSFVGLHPVPIVYGMSIGEYALMISGEQWLAKGLSPMMQVVKIPKYTRSTTTQLTRPPSPNLKSDRAINLYPSLCLFEGTNVSVGRGTAVPFELFGSPDLPDFFPQKFTPISRPGALHPKHENKACRGYNLREGYRLDKINLDWIIKAYKYTKDRSTFFNSFFNKLAGNNRLKKQIEQGMSAQEIRNSWKKDLQKFKRIRKKYLLYPN